MKLIDDIKNLVGEFRSGLAELAQQEQIRLEEAQELRRTVAHQAAQLDEQREIISGLLTERTVVGAALGRVLSDPDSRALSLTEAAQAVVVERDRLRGETTTLRAQLDHAALQLGERNPSPMGPQIKIETAYSLALERERDSFRDQLEHAMQLLADLPPAVPRVHSSSLTDALTVAEDDQRALAAHVLTLLGILDATGGFMPTDYQAAIRAAREAVSGG